MSRQTFWQRFVAAAGVALLVGVVGSRAPDVWADPKGYVFTPLVFLGETTPGGQQFLDVFDSSRINNRGDVLFGSNVTADQEGGLFLLSYGEISQIPARTGEGAPGGGVFSLGTLLPTPSNDKGDVGFIWLRDPFILPPEGPPIGVNGGLVPHPALGQTGSRLRHSSQAQGASWGQCAAASRLRSTTAYGADQVWPVRDRRGHRGVNGVGRPGDCWGASQMLWHFWSRVYLRRFGMNPL
jgi:hypothetical protein